MKLELVIDAVARPWQPEVDVVQLAEDYVKAIGSADAQVLVVVSDDRTLLEHNREFRGKELATDVLSFSYLSGHEDARQELLHGGSVAEYSEQIPMDGPMLVGQVLISIDTVRERGTRHADDLDGEVLFLLTHGLLHVLGFDHEADEDALEMESAEQSLFAPLRERLRARRQKGER